MMQEFKKLVFSDLELIVGIGDLLSAPVDVIVNPANGGLSHGGGLAEQIVFDGGEEIQEESRALVRKQGRLDCGMAVFTTAGRLPYKAIIHAVGPHMGDGNESGKIQQAVTSSLQLCASNHWSSIALPAISTGIFSVPNEVCARGFVAAITSFLAEQPAVEPSTIMICLMENHYSAFVQVFEKQWPDQVETQVAIEVDEPKMFNDSSDFEQKTGLVDLSDENASDLDDDDQIKDWFE